MKMIVITIIWACATIGTLAISLHFRGMVGRASPKSGVNVTVNGRGLTLLRRDLANHLIRNSMIYFMIALSLTGLAGCATIAGSTSYPVTINSSPSEAKFLVGNKSGQELHSGTTPATVSLKSSAGFFSEEKYSVKYAKAGFNDSLSSVDSHISGWYFGNILFGGVLGLLVIDPATGAMWELPNSVSTSLTKQSD